MQHHRYLKCNLIKLAYDMCNLLFFVWHYLNKVLNCIIGLLQEQAAPRISHLKWINIKSWAQGHFLSGRSNLESLIGLLLWMIMSRIGQTLNWTSLQEKKENYLTQRNKKDFLLTMAEVSNNYVHNQTWIWGVKAPCMDLSWAVPSYFGRGRSHSQAYQTKYAVTFGDPFHKLTNSLKIRW